MSGGALQPIDEAAGYDERPFHVEASVTRYRKVRDGGLHTVYTVEARLGDRRWEATRRYREFASLHNQLEAYEFLLLESDSRLPELPPTKLLGNLKTAWLMERLAALDEYLRSVAGQPRFRTHRALLKFLDAPPEVVERLATADPAERARQKKAREAKKAREGLAK